MRYLTLHLLVLISTICHGQEFFPMSSSHENKMDSVANAYLEINQVPGMSIGILKDNKILYSKGHGVKNKDTGEVVTDETVFHMASVSKPFVSTGIMVLVEQGKLNLDDPVTRHLPYFKLADKHYEDITIEQLMLHTAGIPDVGPSVNYEWDNPQYDEKSLERHVKSLASKKLDFKPGRKKPSYSNNGYEILGDVIAKVSGSTFEDFMMDRILRPIEMEQSSFLIKDIPEDLLSSPHIRNEEGDVVVSSVYPYNRKHAPSSCLHSNIRDMLKFAHTNLNKGISNGTPVFSEESHQLLVAPQVRENKIFEFGLGWTTAPYRDTQRVEFTGGDIGFDTVIIMVPTETFAIIILTNGDFNPPAFDVINTAFDLASKY